MATQTIGFKTPPPKCGMGMPLPEGTDIPVMRSRSGSRGSDREMIKLLESALEYLSRSICSFWACEGPRKPKPMCTCSKCSAMREIGTVLATLKARSHGPISRHVTMPAALAIPTKKPAEIAREIVADLRQAIVAMESLTD